MLTVNVVLLGGNIGFFQSMCLLGYCLFPMDVAAIVTACTTNMIARWIVVLVRRTPQHDAPLRGLFCMTVACLPGVAYHAGAPGHHPMPMLSMH